MLFTGLVTASLDKRQIIEANPQSQWYTKYATYHEYCSTPTQMQERGIPPLTIPSDDPKYADLATSIVQVTALIRHGSRTPTKAHTCWDGYWESPSTGIWDCELTTLTAPPAPPAILDLETTGNIDSDEVGYGEMFLFDKQYDALDEPPFYSNILNGTCQVGQLLLQGYPQEYFNGDLLRQTYVHDIDTSDNATDDPTMIENMCLFHLLDGFDESNQKRPFHEPNFYYRADDDQRTIMSGQILIQGLFGDTIKNHWAAEEYDSGAHGDPVMLIHTADRSMDVLSPNADVCPKLLDLQQEAEQSDQYQAEFVESENAKTLNRLIEQELVSDPKSDFQRHASDCLMTTMCTDRDLPDILNDYGHEEVNAKGKEYGGNLFERLYQFSTEPYMHVLRHNDAAYSKLAMGPLWYDIISKMASVIPKSVIPSNIKARDIPNPGPKLNLFSAHDTTLLPILATLGPDVWDGKEWTPYASMIVVELHQIHNSTIDHLGIFPNEVAFRIVFNGVVLTSKVEGCTEGLELCDVVHLMNRVGSFATKERDCSSSAPILDEDDDVNKRPQLEPEVSTSSYQLVGTAIISGVVGSLFTLYGLRHRYGRYDRPASEYTADGFDGGRTLDLEMI